MSDDSTAEISGKPNNDSNRKNTRNKNKKKTSMYQDGEVSFVVDKSDHSERDSDEGAAEDMSDGDDGEGIERVKDAKEDLSNQEQLLNSLSEAEKKFLGIGDDEMDDEEDDVENESESEENESEIEDDESEIEEDESKIESEVDDDDSVLADNGTSPVAHANRKKTTDNSMTKSDKKLTEINYEYGK